MGENLSPTSRSRGCGRHPAPPLQNIFPHAEDSFPASLRRRASSCFRRGHRREAAPISSRPPIRFVEEPLKGYGTGSKVAIVAGRTFPVVAHPCPPAVRFTTVGSSIPVRSPPPLGSRLHWPALQS